MSASRSQLHPVTSAPGPRACLFLVRNGNSEARLFHVHCSVIQICALPPTPWEGFSLSSSQCFAYHFGRVICQSDVFCCFFSKFSSNASNKAFLGGPGGDIRLLLCPSKINTAVLSLLAPPAFLLASLTSSSWCFGKEGSPEPDESPGRASPPSSCPHPCSHVQSSRLGRWPLRDEALGLWDSSVTGQGGHGAHCLLCRPCLLVRQKCVFSTQLSGVSVPRQRSSPTAALQGKHLGGGGASDVLPEPELGGRVQY